MWKIRVIERSSHGMSHLSFNELFLIRPKKSALISSVSPKKCRGFDTKPFRVTFSFDFCKQKKEFQNPLRMCPTTSLKKTPSSNSGSELNKKLKLFEIRLLVYKCNSQKAFPIECRKKKRV
jgi:hypothetical protein